MELFHSGYSQGQTRGFVCTLACFLLMQLPFEPWSVPEIQAALESFTRIKVTYVVYPNSLARSMDSLGPNYQIGCSCSHSYACVLVGHVCTHICVYRFPYCHDCDLNLLFVAFAHAWFHVIVQESNLSRNGWRKRTR